MQAKRGTDRTVEAGRTPRGQRETTRDRFERIQVRRKPDPLTATQTFPQMLNSYSIQLPPFRCI
jgi:hypothetical protein